MRSAFLLMLAVLSLFLARPVAANPQDQIGGSFFFYDYKLDNTPDDPTNAAGIGQAKMLECQGKSKVVALGEGPQVSHCLTFTPDKVGDFISFRIHVATVVPTQSPYSVSTSYAGFGNEGIYQILVDDKPIGPEHDCTRNDGWSHGQFSITPGDYKITYRYVGPSPKSGASSINLMRLDFE